MLQSYEAIYEDGQVTWVAEKPLLSSARTIVTVLEEISGRDLVDKKGKRRRPPASIAGKGKTLGYIVSPIVSGGDWECLE